METKKILLDGFHITFDSRALFMQEMFALFERLTKHGELKKLSRRILTCNIHAEC